MVGFNEDYSTEYYGALAAQYVSAANLASAPSAKDFYTEQASEIISYINRRNANA